MITNRSASKHGVPALRGAHLVYIAVGLFVSGMTAAIALMRWAQPHLVFTERSRLLFGHGMLILLVTIAAALLIALLYLREHSGWLLAMGSAVLLSGSAVASGALTDLLGRTAGGQMAQSFGLVLGNLLHMTAILAPIHRRLPRRDEGLWTAARLLRLTYGLALVLGLALGLASFSPLSGALPARGLWGFSIVAMLLAVGGGLIAAYRYWRWRYVPYYWYALALTAQAVGLFALLQTDMATLLHWMGTLSLSLSWLVMLCASACALIGSDRSATLALRQVILDQSPDAMCLLDADGVYRDGNAGAAQLLGYDAPGDLAGLTLYQFVAPKDAQRVDALLLDLQRDGVVRHVPLHMRHRDGSCLPVELSAGLLRSDVGLYSGMVVTLHDISARLSAQRALQERERILRGVIDQSEDGIALMDVTGRIAEWNPALQAMSGLDRERVIGQPVWEVYALLGTARPRSQDVNAQMRGLIEHFLQTGEGVWLHKLQKIEIPMPSGAVRTVQAVAFPIHVEGQWMAGVIARDISEWLRVEERLHHAERMETVGRLAGGVAHEFNNLLTVINGYAQLLLQQMVSDHPMRDEVQQIELAGQRAANLVRQLLAYARRQVFDIRPLDMNGLLRDMEPRLRQMAHDIALHLDLDESLGALEADRYQMREMILALVDNACDAIRAKRLAVDDRAAPDYQGAITVQTGLVVAGDGSGGAGSATVHHELPPGRYALLAVTDNGEGMSREVQQQLFEPFFSTREVGQGTGLGLPMIYGIIKQLGGVIHVASKLGEGTTMSLYLPLEVRNSQRHARSLRIGYDIDDSVGEWLSNLQDMP
jgi:PAS domain S-box-containing protein